MFKVIAPTARIPQAGGKVTGSITISKDIQWTISSTTPSNGITVSPTTGNSSTTELTFTALPNPGNVPPRTGTFTVSAEGTTPERALTVQVTQEGLPILKIDQTLANLYGAKYNPKLYLPFNYDGRDINGIGSDHSGCISATATISTPYYIEVSKNQLAGTYIYREANKQCTNEWRIPMIIELFAISQNRAMLEAISGFDKVKDSYFWSSSVYNLASGYRCGFGFDGGGYINYSGTSASYYVRCVREVTP